jgi:hypothetical protein
MPRIILTLLVDLLQWLARGMRSHMSLAAENLFLRKRSIARSFVPHGPS